jgi:superfamily II DNA or RNA helicase
MKPPALTMKPLRIYQQDAIAMLRQSLMSGSSRPVLQLATGAGKTRLAAEIIKMMLAKFAARGETARCIFCVPAISLIDQTVAAFVAEGIIDIGVLQGNHPDTRPSAAVQVASVQTLVRRRMPDNVRLVIVDECHKQFAFVSAWMRKPGWERIPFIGLSATPWTVGLGRDYDDLIIAATTQDLIDQKHLAPFRVYAPSKPDLSKVKVVAGDYKEDELAEVMSESGLVADAVQTYKSKGKDENGDYRPALCFAVDRAHAGKLCDQFNDANLAAEYADAFTDRLERNRIGERLRTGKTKVLCNVGIATTGVDWPWVSCISYCRPTKSESLWVQIIGRALRKYDGKRDAIIFDHTGTALSLGLPTDIHYEKLDDGKPDRVGKKKAKRKSLPKECPSCGAVKPAGVHKCPVCGFAPAKQSDLEFASGELAEYRRGPEDLDGTPQPERQRFYAMLVHEATTRGYKPGWVYHKYAEKFGYPPGRDIDRGCQPVAPDESCRRWIRSRQIAWAKGKAKAKGRAA